MSPPKSPGALRVPEVLGTQWRPKPFGHSSGTLRAQSPADIETRVPNTSLLIDLVNGDAPETISASRLYADLDEGFSAFLLKPVRAEQLYATIGHQLGVAFRDWFLESGTRHYLRTVDGLACTRGAISYLSARRSSARKSRLKLWKAHPRKP